MTSREMTEETISWLLSGDVSIQFQVYRDLLGQTRPDLQRRITTEGWGARYLGKRRDDGHWGQGFYMPKWTSTHYTLLDLRNLNIEPEHPLIRESINDILTRLKCSDGGINPAGTIKVSDVCINGMFLDYACYFGAPESELQSVIDYILAQKMNDGGFNCRKNRSGARHSSLHSTLSVLEGIQSYFKGGYEYRRNELQTIEAAAKQFILCHRLFLSDRTGTVINPGFLRFSYPARWRYNVLRAMDYFRFSDTAWDDRMSEAMDVISSKQRRDGFWPVQAAHPGKTHFTMEASRSPSRWVTLLALRIFKHYGR